MLAIDVGVGLMGDKMVDAGLMGDGWDGLIGSELVGRESVGGESVGGELMGGELVGGELVGGALLMSAPLVLFPFSSPLSLIFFLICVSCSHFRLFEANLLM